MNNTFKLTGLSVALASLLLTGCGGSSSSSTPTTPTPSASVKGVLSDGPIANSTVSLLEDGVAVANTTTDKDGNFSFTYELKDGKKYTLQAVGGVDQDTNEDFSGVTFKSPVSLFDDKLATVISPVTSLIAEEVADGKDIDVAQDSVEDKTGLTKAEMKKAPHKDTKVQKIAMKLSMIAKSGKNFDIIAENLDDDKTIDNDDIDVIVTNEEDKATMKGVLTAIDSSADANAIKETYVKQRYIREIIADLKGPIKTQIKSGYKDPDNPYAQMPEDQVQTELKKYLEDVTVVKNIKALSDHFYTENKNLTNNDITATLIAFDVSKLKADDFNASQTKVKVVDSDVSYDDTMKVLYYQIDNPKTLNRQLLAYDYESGKASVINTNVILKDKVFIYGGEKDGNKAKYTTKKYGLYLDPNIGKVTRIGENQDGGKFTYDFYSDNALVRFDPANPSNTSSLFKSSDIPSELKDKGIMKLGNDYDVVENIVDTDNSYVVVKAYDSLFDVVKKESESDKKQTYLTVRLADKKAVAGEPIALVKDDMMKTNSILLSYTDVYTPKETANPSFELRKYNSALTSFEKVADGVFFLATSNDEYVYLYKEGSDKIWAMKKDSATLTEVSGITLAGEYKQAVHRNVSAHGQTSTALTGASTLSGRNLSVSDGTNAYVAFSYDLHPDAVNQFVFGKSGVYKSSQIFKLSGTSGKKIYENGDGTDESLDQAVNTDKNNGHINLIVVSNDKLFVETGWNDGNKDLGGQCTTGYPVPTAPNGMGCTKVKYGYIDTNTQDTVTDTQMLKYDVANNEEDKDMLVQGIPYYVSRRVAPLASDGKLYISLFAGGSSSSGYIHNLYTFDLGSETTDVKKEGRTYFVKAAKSTSGEFSGQVISWSKTTNTVTTPDGTNVGDTSKLNNNAGGRSVSALTSGVPLAGIGNIAMLKNDKGGHNFELFAVDGKAAADSFKAVDLAPFGGWIYE